MAEHIKMLFVDNISYLLSNDVTATSLLKILQCARLDIEHDICNLNKTLAQPGVRKVEASAPWAVGSATRA